MLLYSSKSVSARGYEGQLTRTLTLHNKDRKSKSYTISNASRCFHTRCTALLLGHAMPGICSCEPGQEQLVDQGRGRIQGICFSCHVCLDGRKNEEALLETNVRIPAPHQRQKNVVCNAFSRELSYFFLPSLPTFKVGGLNSRFLGFALLTSGIARSSTSKLATFSS